jgi:hypothetical protein
MAAVLSLRGRCFAALQALRFNILVTESLQIHYYAASTRESQWALVSEADAEHWYRELVWKHPPGLLLVYSNFFDEKFLVALPALEEAVLPALEEAVMVRVWCHRPPIGHDAKLCRGFQCSGKKY